MSYYTDYDGSKPKPKRLVISDALLRRSNAISPTSTDTAD